MTPSRRSLGKLLIQALTAADATTDFREFDNDGPDGISNSGDDNGFVDVLTVEFLESSITCSGNGPTIWAHRSSISGWTHSPFMTDDVGPGGECPTGWVSGTSSLLPSLPTPTRPADSPAPAVGSQNSATLH